MSCVKRIFCFRNPDGLGALDFDWNEIDALDGSLVDDNAS
jgi:hypothetical protein